MQSNDSYSLNNMEDKSVPNEVKTALTELGLQCYFDKLYDYGVDSIAVLQQSTQEDIEMIMKDCGIKKTFHKRKFDQWVQGLINTKNEKPIETTEGYSDGHTQSNNNVINKNNQIVSTTSIVTPTIPYYNDNDNKNENEIESTVWGDIASQASEVTEISKISEIADNIAIELSPTKSFQRRQRKKAKKLKNRMIYDNYDSNNNNINNLNDSNNCNNNSEVKPITFENYSRLPGAVKIQVISNNVSFVRFQCQDIPILGWENRNCAFASDFVTINKDVKFNSKRNCNEEYYYIEDISMGDRLIPEYFSKFLTNIVGFITFTLQNENLAYFTPFAPDLPKAIIKFDNNQNEKQNFFNISESKNNNLFVICVNYRFNDKINDCVWFSQNNNGTKDFAIADCYISYDFNLNNNNNNNNMISNSISKDKIIIERFWFEMVSKYINGNITNDEIEQWYNQEEWLIKSKCFCTENDDILNDNVTNNTDFIKEFEFDKNDSEYMNGTHLNIFTIYPNDAKLYEFGVSIEIISKNKNNQNNNKSSKLNIINNNNANNQMIRVGMHFPDVSKFDSFLKQFEKNLINKVETCDFYSLLPDYIGEQCSLKQDCIRYVNSFFINLNENGDIIENLNIKGNKKIINNKNNLDSFKYVSPFCCKLKIKSKGEFNYDQVDSMIESNFKFNYNFQKSNNYNNGIECIRILWKLHLLRKFELQNNENNENNDKKHSKNNNNVLNHNNPDSSNYLERLTFKLIKNEIKIKRNYKKFTKAQEMIEAILPIANNIAIYQMAKKYNNKILIRGSAGTVESDIIHRLQQISLSFGNVIASYFGNIENVYEIPICIEKLNNDYKNQNGVSSKIKRKIKLISQIAKTLELESKKAAEYVIIEPSKNVSDINNLLKHRYQTHFARPLRRYADILVQKLIFNNNNDFNNLNLNNPNECEYIRNICKFINRKHIYIRNAENEMKQLPLKMFLTTFDYNNNNNNYNNYNNLYFEARISSLDSKSNKIKVFINDLQMTQWIVCHYSRYFKMKINNFKNNKKNKLTVYWDNNNTSDYYLGSKIWVTISFKYNDSNINAHVIKPPNFNNNNNNNNESCIVSSNDIEYPECIKYFRNYRN